MNTHNLPPADQPDNYTGSYPGLSPDITMDTADSSLLHILTIGPRKAGTYCSAMPGAPMGFTRWFSISAMLDLATKPLSLKGKAGPPMSLCAHCCTMLAAEIEMNGQNAYRTKTLVNALRALEPNDTAHPRGKRHA